MVVRIRRKMQWKQWYRWNAEKIERNERNEKEKGKDDDNFNVYAPSHRCMQGEDLLLDGQGG